MKQSKVLQHTDTINRHSRFMIFAGSILICITFFFLFVFEFSVQKSDTPVLPVIADNTLPTLKKMQVLYNIPYAASSIEQNGLGYYNSKDESVYVYKDNTHAKQQVSLDLSHTWDISWSPTLHAFTYESNEGNGIYVFETNKNILFPYNAEHLTWSQDASLVAYQERNEEDDYTSSIVTVDVTQADFSTYATIDSGHFDFTSGMLYPLWISDTELLVTREQADVDLQTWWDVKQHDHLVLGDTPEKIQIDILDQFQTSSSFLVFTATGEQLDAEEREYAIWNIDTNSLVPLSIYGSLASCIWQHEQSLLCMSDIQDDLALYSRNISTGTTTMYGLITDVSTASLQNVFYNKEKNSVFLHTTLNTLTEYSLE